MTTEPQQKPPDITPAPGTPSQNPPPQESGNNGVPTPATEPANDPFGKSLFSPYRYSNQHFFLVIVILALLVTMTVQAVTMGNPTYIALSATSLILSIVKTVILVYTGLRTIKAEIWIRRMGMGDLEYRVEAQGRDEISKAFEALEALRQSSIRAMQLDLVQKLSAELQERNEDLESTLGQLRRTQDQMVSQQKLAELGELSAGVAHEMRNPLQFISNFTQSSRELTQELERLIRLDTAQDQQEAADLLEEIASNMERVLHHSNRANGIVSSMLTLDRGAGGSFRPTNLNQLVTQQAHLALRAAQLQDPDLQVSMELDLDPDLPEILAVPEDIARVITNLVSNSCQAMAQKARQAPDYAPSLRVTTIPTQEGVSLTCHDNGHGIDPAVMQRMFNPFFTTRDSLRNTGLGLSLAYDIVREHGGSISPQSDPGAYARFTVDLPLQQEQPPAPASWTTPHTTSTSGNAGTAPSSNDAYEHPGPSATGGPPPTPAAP